MKYTVEIDIAVPIEKVIDLFDSSENMRHWQPDLLSFETISGKPGQVGSEARLVYQMGNREVVMTEVITRKDLPQIFAGVYETDNVWNLVENSFIDLGNGNTRWVCTNEFKCSGFVRLMALLMPGMFKKQSVKYQEQFKSFAETAY
ncbi:MULTISPECIES: SRPBCC family protein [unclassified Thalassotalea]|uniref:SRPBCC family protein n=1 Tax=unclassified Thalassotalea TaxID=2614972 RepID=UPI001080A32A|nr:MULTISPECIES: SRPBCC family protein [unclassified Thalassotalea]NMP16735.1 SRPBCC family protein [Thalassotalea sp. Y01]QBY05602.1 SRPBCC family protein [Thalassotalea sp. HSM 43]